MRQQVFVASHASGEADQYTSVTVAPLVSKLALYAQIDLTLISTCCKVEEGKRDRVPRPRCGAKVRKGERISELGAALRPVSAAGAECSSYRPATINVFIENDGLCVCQ